MSPPHHFLHSLEVVGDSYRRIKKEGAAQHNTNDHDSEETCGKKQKG